MTPIVPSRSELFVESGPELGQIYHLSPLSSQPQGLLIGRLENCYVKFPPDTRMIGREHACIVLRPEGVFLLGLHQNGTFVDGILVGKGGQIELRYGARIQIGKEGPVLVVREQQKVAFTPVGSSTQYALPTTESEVDIRAELDALKEANRELDRQNQQLRGEKDALLQKVNHPERTPPPPALSANNDEAKAVLRRFSQGLLGLQKMMNTGEPDLTALQGKLELLIFDLADLHNAVSEP